MTKTFIVRFIAAILLISSISVAAYATFQSSDTADKNIVFSDRTLLAGLWDNYKKVYWEESTGRTLDKQQNNITTSEGQSYTMLRAVWQSDQPTFDKAWGWTKEHLGRQDDELFSWRWGQKNDGTYGVLTDMGGQNTASDADSDIALALIMAASKWQKQTYLEEARAIVRDIWEEEVITVNGIPYLTSNNLEKDSQKPAIINPSYLAPYAYRHFAKIDKRNNWDGLVDSSYDLIDRSIESNLDKGTSAKIVPDWVTINEQNGSLAAVQGAPNLTTNYGYDAMRTPLRIALDYKWNKEPRAKETLNKMQFFSREWKNKGKIVSTYAHDGTIVKDEEVAEAYATILGYFIVADPSQAADVYDKKLKPLYDPDKNSWAKEMSYYGDNWAWFGIALYNDQLDNLAADIQ